MVELTDIDGGGAAAGGLGHGVEVIRGVLRTLPETPGVYRMLDAKGDALYVGKARSLKHRVAYYTRHRALPRRLQRMVAQTRSMEIVVTHTEIEALLLEGNLIQRLAPRYNLVLKDESSFPWIHLTGGHDFPRLSRHRGARGKSGDYFGPFASRAAADAVMLALQRAFLLRSCSDDDFAGRDRPCLLHQIKRCSAPCAGRIDRGSYARLVQEARDFQSGRSRALQRRLAERMHDFAERLEFERAAVVRDRIRALTQLQSRAAHAPGVGDADVVAAHQEGGQSCIQVFFFRQGQNWGNRAYFPAHDRFMPVEEVLGAFLGQLYDKLQPPGLVLLSHAPPERALLAEALASCAGRRVDLAVPRRGDRRAVVGHALVNAREALGRRLAEATAQRKLLAGVAQAFGLAAAPRRIEVYDNSHIQGTHAVGAMIVAGPEGLVRSAYRHFTLGGAGDDCAMMREMLGRRFSRALKDDPTREHGTWPDLLLVDGAAGQLAAAQEVLFGLGVGDIPVLAIAKGPERDAGRERFFQPGRPPRRLDPGDPVLHYLQRLRDEAHRFAIGAHRAKRARAITASPLDEIPGIGARRKRALLDHFGSARGAARAGVVDLERVDGISKGLAQKIHQHFHAGS